MARKRSRRHEGGTMYLSPEEARKRWCPFVRAEGSNRALNMSHDGFENAPASYCCIADKCMMWRSAHPHHMKEGAIAAFEGRGYCALGERPEFE